MMYQAKIDILSVVYITLIVLLLLYLIKLWLQ